MIEMMVLLQKKLEEELPDLEEKQPLMGNIIQMYVNKISTKEADGRREMQGDTTE